MRLILIAVIFVGAVATLITVGVIARAIPVLDVGQILAADSDYEPGTTVAVQRGRILEIECLAPKLRFRYGKEGDPAASILVESSRTPPDNFRVGLGATIEGTYDPSTRTFEAYSVATNCPSRYDPKEESENLEREARSRSGGSGANPYGPPPAESAPAIDVR